MSKSSPTRWAKAVPSAVVACLAFVFLFSGIGCVEVKDAATKLKDSAEAVATSQAAEAVEAITKGDAAGAVGAVTSGQSSAAGASIKVGDKFPALSLKDQTGEAFDLSKTLQAGPVALVIFRSADW